MTSDGKNKAGYFNVQQKYIEAFNKGDVDTLYHWISAGGRYQR